MSSSTRITIHSSTASCESCVSRSSAVLKLQKIRELNLERPSAPGRAAHVSAASGLVVVQSSLYVVADDENSIAVFPIQGDAPGRLVQFTDGQLPEGKQDRKRLKPDMEALLLLPPFGSFACGALLAMGSGSRRNRQQGALFALDAQGAVEGRPRLIDFSPMLAALRTQVGELNIEGALLTQDRFMLLQRGNKGGGVNASISMSRAELLAALAEANPVAEIRSEVRRYELGSMNGIPFGFTDGAALPDGRIVFTAVAEDADDSYADGPCAGAIIGMLSADGQLLRMERMEPAVKVEGVDASIEGDHLKLLLVTDADDAAISASLYECAWSCPA